MIAVSIVSHGHGDMVCRLATQLLEYPEVSRLVITLNVPEKLPLSEDARIEVVCNDMPRGFAENHNQAFLRVGEPYFCPLNPDVELQGNPFSVLLTLLADERVGMVAPQVVSPGGLHEDSWRHFPTLTSLLRKALGMGDGRYRLPGDGRPFSPEWVAGMFMLFRSDVFRCLGGFDEDFFLYYEDVDICTRLWKNGYRLLACPAVSVVHDAQRDSRRKWRHLRWHLGSMARYFAKHWGRLPRCAGDFQ
jgi:N-acetylglucosaminyl-diphospho-decaprenol L-rhamnosyltransferase